MHCKQIIIHGQEISIRYVLQCAECQILHRHVILLRVSKSEDYYKGMLNQGVVGLEIKYRDSIFKSVSGYWFLLLNSLSELSSSSNFCLSAK